MPKTLTYFFLIYTLFLSSTLTQAQDLKQGLYSFNGGLANQKLTKKYIYGPSFHYRYSEDFEITGLGLKHNFIKDFALAYGLENYETNRLGIKFPFFIRVEKNFKFTSLEIQTHVSDRYFPEFYSDDTLHFLSTGIAFKEKMTNSMALHMGGELHRLFNREQIIFGNIFAAVEKTFVQKYYVRLEYSDPINNKRVPHLYDWLATATVGFIY